MKYKSSVIIAFAVLLIFLGTYFLPFLKSANTENRTLATFGMVVRPEKDSVVYRDSPAERLDAALSDQFAFREAAVNRYLRLFNSTENFVYGLMKRFDKAEEHQYSLQVVGDYVLIEDTEYISVYPYTTPLSEADLQKHADQIRLLHDLYPELKMYVYYVTQAYDTSWFDDFIGTTSGDHYREIKEALPDYVDTDCLEYEDLEDYLNIHFKTDHHWNHRGAQRGYENICAMLRDDFELGKIRVPVSEFAASDTYGFRFRGSYAKGLGKMYQGTFDDFSFYEYDLPDRETAAIDPETRREIPLEKIGLYDEYSRGEIDKSKNMDHYIRMYGAGRGTDGELYKDSAYPFVIRNSEGNGRNLLIVGDSYGRAVRDPLASHFDTTVYIDYRNLAAVPIDYLIEHYGIDAMVLCSHVSLWNENGYYFTFGEDE